MSNTRSTSSAASPPQMWCETLEEMSAIYKASLVRRRQRDGKEVVVLGEEEEEEE